MNLSHGSQTCLIELADHKGKDDYGQHNTRIVDYRENRIPVIVSIYPCSQNLGANQSSNQGPLCREIFTGPEISSEITTEQVDREYDPGHRYDVRERDQVV